MSTKPSDQLKPSPGAAPPALSPWRRWARGRSGTGGAVFAVFVVAFIVVPAPSSSAGQGAFRSRAILGLAQVALVAVLLGIVCVWERTKRNSSSDSDVERAARWCGRPSWSCSPPAIFLGTAATGALLLVWIPLGPFVDRLWSHGPPGTYNNPPDLRASTILAMAIVTVVCAPILEELFFRGGLQSWLGRRLPHWAGVLVSTVAFTWAHGFGPGAYNSVQLLSVFGSGLLYAGLYQASGSVMPGIAAHMARNGSIVVSLATGAPILLPAATAALVGLIGLWWSWRRTSGRGTYVNGSPDRRRQRVHGLLRPGGRLAKPVC